MHLRRTTKSKIRAELKKFWPEVSRWTLNTGGSLPMKMTKQSARNKILNKIFSVAVGKVDWSALWYVGCVTANHMIPNDPKSESDIEDGKNVSP